MKTTILKCIGLAAFLNVLSFPAAIGQTIYNVTDWYATTSAGSTLDTSISGGNGASPSVVYGNPTTSGNVAGTYLWSYFADNSSPASLLDGDSLTFSAGLSLSLTSASSAAVSMRFGIFDSTTPRASTTSGTGLVSYGVDRIGDGTTQTNARNGWSGVFSRTVASGVGTISRRLTGVDSAFFSSGVSNVTTVNLTNSVTDKTFADDTPITLTLTLSRTGNDLSFSGALGADTFAGTYTNYFAGGYPATFDTVGFYFDSAAAAVTSLNIVGATLSVVPEPATTVLALGATSILLALRRRRR
jgi:hypothetical protein